MSTGALFPEFRLSHEMLRDLQRMNPWWEGNPLPLLPPTRCHLVETIHKSPVIDR